MPRSNKALAHFVQVVELGINQSCSVITSAHYSFHILNVMLAAANVVKFIRAFTHSGSQHAIECGSSFEHA